MNSFVVYVDEAGDEGFAFARGSSSWFVLSAAVTRKATDLETVKLVDRVRARLRKAPRASLHFRYLKHQQRLVLASEISQARLHAVSVLAYKPALRESDRFAERFRLYFYCVRLLLERVSWLCRDRRRRTDPGDGSARIYFSNRSSMSYDELRSYLRLLEQRSASEELRIDWSVIRPHQVQPRPAHHLMGLQIADAIASSFFVALEPSGYGFTEDRYVRMMRPIVYRHRGRYLGYGVKLWPPEVEELVATDQLHQWYPYFAASRSLA